MTTETPPTEAMVSTKVDTRTPLIYSRIAACIGEIEAVGKDHKNQQQGYSFRAIDDFFNNLQPVLAKYRVFVTPTILSHTREERTTKSGGILMTTLTHVRFRVFTEDGSFIEADALGEGSDSGDKSANKSASQALKYLFMQVFCVRVSGENQDPERESPAYNAKPAQTNRREYPVSSDRTYQKPAPQANVERPAATPAAVLPEKKEASPKTREFMPQLLQTNVMDDNAIHAFFLGKGWIADTMDIADWPLEHVPTSKQALAALADEIRKTLPQEACQQIVDTDLPPEIAACIITVPRRGMKKADYMTNPDTIGSLYSAIKAGDEEARKRLWGMAKGWSPEPYVDANQKKWPVKPEDAQCRIDLDAFLAWYEEKHGNTDSDHQ